MSLIRLGSAATRRQHVAPADFTARSLPGLATTAETETKTERAFASLVQYIPTETITLFLAAVSLVNSLDHVPFFAQLHPLYLVALFTILTPLMLLFAAYATFFESKRENRIPAAQKFVWPRFDMIASALAFLPWALAVPGLFPDAANPENPMAQTPWTNEVIQLFAAFLAFVVSWLLSQLRRIFGTS